MANSIGSFARLSSHRISSFACLSSHRIRSFSAFASAMQDVKPRKIQIDGSSRKRNMKWLTSYSRMSQEAAFKRLGFDLEDFVGTAIPVQRMISQANCEIEDIGENAINVMTECLYSYD